MRALLRSTSVKPLKIGSSIFWRHWTQMRRTVRSMKIWRGKRRRNKKRYICEKRNNYRRRMNGIRQGTWRCHVYLMGLTPLVNRYVAPLKISCCYYQTWPDEGVSLFFNTSTHTRGFLTSNTLASTSHLRIYLLRVRCSITWIHRYAFDTQVCSCACFGYRHLHITPRVTFHRSHHLPQVPAGFQSLQSTNPALTFHICIIIRTRRRPTLLHHAHIQIYYTPPHITIPLFDESLLMTSCLLLHQIIIHHLS